MRQILLHTSYTLDTIDAAAAQFWQASKPYHLLAFSGEMGAGKTTFISHLCHYLHVRDAVTSPTFALINEYRYPVENGTDKTIFHIDLYRLKDTDDAINAGMEDCIDQAKNGSVYCFVEWPEKAKELLHKPYLWISIETTGEQEREMTVSVVN